jgi:small subunit ribosomal protein S20
MAITKGAKKAHRASERKRVFNTRRKTALTDVVKKVRKHIAAGELKEAGTLMPAAYKAIDKAAKRGVIKPNTAARKKSRLMGTLKRKEVQK